MKEIKTEFVYNDIKTKEEFFELEERAGLHEKLEEFVSINWPYDRVYEYVVVYHRVDYDGVISAATAAVALWNTELVYKEDVEPERVYFYGYNHRDKIDYHIFEQTKNVIILDISFPPEDMLKLREIIPGDIIWIDHHLTSIEDSIEHGYDDLPGIRNVSGKAACELAWEYFFPNVETPLGVLLVSVYDTWRKDNEHDLSWYKDVLPFQSGLRYYFGVSLFEVLKSTRSGQFDSALRVLGLNLVIDGDVEWFEPETGLIESIIETGRIITAYEDKKWERQVRNNSFEVLVDGKYKAVAMLTPEFSSRPFESVSYGDYDIVIPLNYSNSTDSYRISMYIISPVLEDSDQFSAGEYMRKFNGGGHKNAAGGTLSLEQFIELLRSRTI